ncbi:putative amidohydrolase [Mesoflavibacter sabulilitoris]|uniref:Omega-amidase YafV n=1 Tax=Mesoflavibacter zeaxanthinifaciens subsp. sabulilitoris TaxID=1520893 RepID=A0A2T1N5P3_9FLAO|nr:nitrilase family protein [Mesoflavibacter zeaxanthinifaciens]MBB3123446.1 putative amidohydrolase [Mesoflavibacter zeaxanthinifaciens subsp. sabulilitoris]PSG86922.1 nitrilase family protein [Mesoflavibacter zeaxanthinifaciens subsp. sabulilitoris]
MEENSLHVAIIQADLVWENPNQNRENFTKKIEEITQDVDLIVLPEMFTSGFTMTPEHIAETEEGETIIWMKKMAFQKNAAIVGSVAIKDNSDYYNRLFFVHTNGLIDTYDKKHTFTLAGEDKVYKRGNSKVIVNYKGFKIQPLICYDLRFPVWSRIAEEDYDVLIYVANWPKIRVHAWNTLLQARAIENMSYCIGVNRVGLDANNYEYSGHSAVYDALGKKLSTIQPNFEGVEVIVLNKKHIDDVRSKLRFLDDKDSFSLE